MNTEPRGRHRAQSARRLPVLLAVAAVVLVGGLIDHLVAAPAVTGDAAAVAAEAAPTGAESSSWFCTGGTGTSGEAVPTVFLANTSSTTVTGTLSVLNDSGASVTTSLALTPGTEQAVQPAQLEAGNYYAVRVDLSGGGVVVTQSVAGPTGWASAPCTSATASDWYFGGASTVGGDDQLSLYNPTATPAVADLLFLTPAGVTTPQPYQGVVVAPGTLVVVGVGTYVQNATSVATIVDVTAGRLVAAQVAAHLADNLQGLSLESGVPAPADSWSFPRSDDLAGATTAFEVVNPNRQPEHVTVRFRLPWGPVAPVTDVVAPMSSWSVPAGQMTRVPAGTDYATTVTATGGPGVVVTRTVLGPTGSVAPQWGVVAGLPPTASDGASVTVVTAPDAGGVVATAGATPLALSVVNRGATTVRVEVDASRPGGTAPVTGGVFELRPGDFRVLGAQVLPPDAPVVVRAGGPVGVMEDLIPAAMAGVVALAGVAMPAG